MSDDEDYISEEDLDYVPSEGEQVSEEENSGDEEDLSVLQDGETDVKAGSARKKAAGKKKKEDVLAVRKRKGGIKLEDESKAGEKEEDEKDVDKEEAKRKKELASQIAQEEVERKQEKEKKRADDLWSSFMSDIPKPPSRSSNQTTAVSSLAGLSACQAKPATTQHKVTITKVFDFAGEEVKVTKEVDANSKEAQEEKKKQEKPTEEKEEASPSPLVSAGQSLLPMPSLKRPVTGSGGLGSVLNKIGKKSKMGTLEKSKLDWESFKTKEGIKEDLKIHNKGKQGYTERMAFLNRADQRQFEIERDLRLGTSSKR